MTFKVEKGVGKLGNDVVLRNCSAYLIKELTYEGFFKHSGEYVLYNMIGPRKKDLEKKVSGGYAILGDWTISTKMQEARDRVVKLHEESMAQETDEQTRKSHQMMLDYLIPTQRVLILKSSDAKNDFTLAYGLTPIQDRDFKFAPENSKKMKDNKRLVSVEFTLN